MHILQPVDSSVKHNISSPYIAPPTTKRAIDHAAERPVVPPVNFDGIPDALKVYPHWVLWRRDWAPGKDGKPGKWTKVPYRPSWVGPRRKLFYERASSVDPRTWTDYETLALHLTLISEFGGGGVWGLGYCPHDDDPHAYADLDNCRNPATGEIQPLAMDIVRRMSSYTEVSPSGTGLRVFVEATKPAGSRFRAKDNGVEIEVYDRAHFTTITGDHVAGMPLTVQPRQAALDAVRADFMPERTPAPATTRTVEAAGAGPFNLPVDLSDAELIDKAMASEHGAEFTHQWSGSTAGFKTHSEADWALMKSLAWWTNRDAARAAKLFRQSGLYRPRKGKDYPERTARKACARTTGGYGDGFNRCGWAAKLAKLADADPDQVALVNPAPLGADGADALARAAPCARSADLSDLDAFRPAAARPERLDYRQEAADATDATRRRFDFRQKQIDRLDAELHQLAADDDHATRRALASLPARPAVQPAVGRHKQAAAVVCSWIEQTIASAFEGPDGDGPARNARCATGELRGYYGKDDPHEFFFASWACDSLTCDHCVCRLRAFWKRHGATVVLHEIPDGADDPTNGERREHGLPSRKLSGLPPQPRNLKLHVRDDLKIRTAPVYFWIGPPGQEDTMKKRIDRACKDAGRQKAGGRVASAFGKVVLLVSDAPFDGAEPVEPVEAAKRLTWHIDHARRDRRKGITFWGRWKTPEIVTRYSPFVVTATSYEAQIAVQDAGVEFLHTFGPGDPSLSCLNSGFAGRFPDRMTNAAVLRVLARLDVNNDGDKPTPLTPEWAAEIRGIKFDFGTDGASELPHTVDDLYGVKRTSRKRNREEGCHERPPGFRGRHEAAATA